MFKKLNARLLEEKEEIKKALCEAYESMPRPVDYKDKVLKFTHAVEALQNPDVSAEDKNQYLKDIIARIDYDRPPSIRITKENEHLYNVPKKRGARFYHEPFKISISLK